MIVQFYLHIYNYLGSPFLLHIYLPYGIVFSFLKNTLQESPPKGLMVVNYVCFCLSKHVLTLLFFQKSFLLDVYFTQHLEGCTHKGKWPGNMYQTCWSSIQWRKLNRAKVSNRCAMPCLCSTQVPGRSGFRFQEKPALHGETSSQDTVALHWMELWLTAPNLSLQEWVGLTSSLA